MLSSDRDEARIIASMKVLTPLPSAGFDPSEAAVSWKVLSDAGHEIVFATPDGARAAADPIMLSGKGLDPWGFLPGLDRVVAVGRALRANAVARAAYRALEADAAFGAPLSYDAIDPDAFDALLLPGGHAKPMRAYLESRSLQRVVAAFFDAGKPVGAICHGVVLAARSISARDGRSVLHGRRTTALTWKLERSAWTLTRFFARFWDPDYYRTYAEQPGDPPGYMSVEAEVTRALARPEDFLAPADFRRASGLFRDTLTDPSPAFVVVDRNYVSARWPGDAHTFAKEFAKVLAGTNG
jgi:putative intracellular protease/amidase